MSKFDDPEKVAEIPSSTIELLKDPIPATTPPDNTLGRSKALGENEVKPDPKAEVKTAMLDTPKDGVAKPVNNTPKEEPINQPTWVERMEGTKRAFNENNSESKGKNLHNAQPASATVTTEKSEPPKVEPKASEFVKRLQSTPPPTNKPSGPRK